MRETRQIASTFGIHFLDAERFSLTRNLAALATAFIELNEGAAVQFIEEAYFRAPTETPRGTAGSLPGVFLYTARMVTLTCGISWLRAIECCSEVHPVIAPMVVADLIDWERWDLKAEISEICDSTILDDDGLMRQYLDMAIASGNN